MTTALLCYSTLTSSLWKQNSKESYALCSSFEVFPSWDLKYIMVVLVKIKNSSNCITQETNVYKCSALCQCSSQHHQQSTGSSCDVDCTTSVSVSDLWLQSQTVQTSWKSSLFVAVPTSDKKKYIYRTYTVNSNMLHLMEGWNGIKVQTYIFRQTRKKFCFLFFLFFHLLVTSFSIDTDNESTW